MSIPNTGETELGPDETKNSFSGIGGKSDFQNIELKTGETAVDMKCITKKFPGTLANDNIDFEVKSGEIHALLGENGAGKTTLMNILYGLYSEDSGEIRIYGKKVDIKSPRDAINRGIGMVHQLFKQVQRHTVAENVALTVSTGQLYPVQKAGRKFSRLSKEFGWDIDLDVGIWQLSAEEQQRIDILKVILQGAKILILDEPTSVLTPQGKEELFEKLRIMREEGYAIIYITHKLDEVMNISDRVTILRKGRKVSTVKTSETDKKELARKMIGREVIFDIEKGSIEKGEAVLKVDDIYVLGDRGEMAVRGVSFSIHESEILGLAGVGGNGQRELIEALTGLRKIKRGNFKVYDDELTNASPHEIVEKGVNHIPEDRDRRGLIPTMSVKENLMLRDYRDTKYSNRFFLDFKKINEEVRDKIARYNIVTPNPDTQAELLSGGNLQRLVLAREISSRPNLLIAAYPTHGLDVGSIEDIQNLLLEQRENGSAVFLISEDLDEIIRLSDRIAVIYEGELMCIIDSDKICKEEIGLIMAGTPAEEVI